MFPAERIAQLEALVEKLRSENANLRQDNAELRERLAKSSLNSSRPPSTDSPKDRTKRPKKKSSGRTPGGQPGHEKHERPEVPPEMVSKRIVLRPQKCERCESALVGDDTAPTRHQVFELPRVEPIVTEYVQHALVCPCCDHVTRAELPAGVPTRIFGPSVDATIALMMGVYRMSKRMTADALRDLYGLPISVGSIINAQREASLAIEVPVAEAHDFARAQPIKNADETGWKEAGSSVWLWALVTATVTVFQVRRSRAEDAARNLLGPTCGVLGSDRHGAYNFWPSAMRQFCWAHLIRDFTAIQERGDASGVVGRQLLQETDRMFAWWYRVRDGTLSRSTFQVYMSSLRRRVESHLKFGSRLREMRTARTCAKILKASDSLWTFVRIGGVEPTNNGAERAVRHPVICRKLSGGTKSPEGSEFVGRILTVHATLRQQRRGILAFLTDACKARLSKRDPPSLLPAIQNTPRLIAIAR